MKKPGNKVISIYIIWGLINFALLFSPKKGKILYWGGHIFYPFTKEKVYNEISNTLIYATNWNANAYDLSEFTFYMIAPILIYYAITFWNKKPNE
jgi:hypothetical protein